MLRSTVARLGFLVAILALAFTAAHVSPLFALAPLVAVKGAPLALAGFGKLTSIGFGLLGTVADVATPTLVTKNRQVNELRSQAKKLLDEIGDTANVTMTLDEVKTKQTAMNALLARANAMAEFTGKDEIERQGGEGELIPVEGEGTTRTEIRAKRTGMQARLDEYSKRVISEFGDVRGFLDVAVSGRGAQKATEAQRKLISENQTLTRAIVGTAGDISGGEFLLPLTQTQNIFSLQNVQQGLLQRARAYNVPGRTLRIPYLVQTDENASTTLNRPMAGQIANVGIVGEGSTKPARTPEFGQRLLTVYKYAAITQVSDEMLADDFTGELPAEFINAVGQQALNAVNEDITINGSGTSMPTAALYPDSEWNIEVARNTPGTILPVDLFAMYARHTHGPNSVWFASRRTVQSLYAMSLTAASLVTFLRNLNDTPQMMILGYPVILTDLLNTVGTNGDIALVNPDFYAFALRQALTVESSRDFAFTQDLTTYRFIVRAGGLPINTGKYAYAYAGSNGIDEHSPFVYLGDDNS